MSGIIPVMDDEPRHAPEHPEEQVSETNPPKESPPRTPAHPRKQRKADMATLRRLFSRKHLARLAAFVYRKTLADAALELAAALVYRTIFSLIPIAVMGLLVFRMLGGFESVGAEVRTWMYDKLGFSAIELVPVDDAGTEEAGSDGVAGPMVAEGTLEAKANLEKVLDGITERIAGADFNSIGVVGVLVLIWAALGLFTTLEDTFNRVYGARRGRPWHLRVPLFWAVLTLGPLVLAFSLVMTGKVGTWVGDIPYVGTLVRGTTWLFGMAATWLVLWLMYLLLPTTTVRIRAVMVGSFVAALLWEAGKWGFQLYVGRVVSYSVLYGTLGLVPLFLLWVYLTWIIVIMGLELSYAVQRFMVTGDLDLRWLGDEGRFVDPLWIVPLGAEIARRFADGGLATERDLVEALDLPPYAVGKMLESLEHEGIIRRAADDSHEGFVLGRLPESIRCDDLVDLARATVAKARDVSESPAWAYVEGAHRCVRTHGEGTTLADLLGLPTGEET